MDAFKQKFLIFILACFPAFNAVQANGEDECIDRIYIDGPPELTKPVRANPFNFVTYSRVYPNNKYWASCAFIKNYSNKDIEVNWTKTGISGWIPHGDNSRAQIINIQNRNISSDEINFLQPKSCLFYGDKPFKTEAPFFWLLPAPPVTQSPNVGPESVEGCAIKNGLITEHNIFKIESGFHFSTDAGTFVRLNKADPETLIEVNAHVSWIVDAQVGIVNQVEFSADHYGLRTGGNIDDVRISVSDDFSPIAIDSANIPDIDRFSIPGRSLLIKFEKVYRHSEPLNSNKLQDDARIAADTEKFFFNSGLTRFAKKLPDPVSNVAWHTNPSDDAKFTVELHRSIVSIQDKDGNKLGSIEVPYITRAE